MNILRNLKITHKLLLVLGIVVVGFLAVGLAYKLVLDTNEKAVRDTDRLAQTGRLVESVRVGLLSAQRAHSHFLLQRDLQFVTEFENEMTIIREQIGELNATLTSDLDRQLLTRISDVLRNYHSNFYDVAETVMALGLDENGGLQGELRASVHAAEKVLNKLGKPVLTASMLSMRRHEKDFILRQEDKYVDQMEQEQARFSALMKREALPTRTASQLHGMMDDYQKKFLEFVAATRRLGAANSALANIASQMGPLFGTMIREANRVVADNFERIDARKQVITQFFIGILTAVGVVVAVVLLLFSRGITRSLSRLTAVVRKVGAGDFGVRAQLATRDELGALGDAFDSLLDERLANLSSAEKQNDELNDSIILLLEAVSELSQKDLTVSVPVSENVTGPVADAMNLMASETARVLKQISQVAEDVELAANMVKQQGDTVVDVAAGERRIIEQAMVKLEEAANTMNGIAALAQACNEMATRASASTETALETVNHTVEGMNEIRETISETEKRIKRLGERSQEITAVVEIINNIAERTHVLALNASMQAAAAGEAGRGFAVVADEVQRLAESSRNSTSQIAALVNNIQTETSETMTTMNKTISQVVEGSQRAERAGKEMQATQQNTSELVSTVKQIAERSVVQAQVSNELHDESVNIHKSTQQTAEALKQQTEETQKLVRYSKHLLEAVRVFKLPERGRARSEENDATPAEDDADTDTGKKDGNWTSKRVVGA